MSPAALTLVCPRVADTVALGERLGRALDQGELLSLEGPLGAGKTTLVRGIAIGAGADPQQVRSPTFVLHHVYRGSRHTLHHLDLYRLSPQSSLVVLDIEGLLASGAVVVEWGDHSGLSRWDPIRVRVEIGDAEERVLTLTSPAPSRIRQAWDAWAP